jgi:hypothetical protein
MEGQYLPFGAEERESAAPAWGYAPKTLFNKLEVFHNKVLRIITKLPG